MSERQANASKLMNGDWKMLFSVGDGDSFGHIGVSRSQDGSYRGV